MNKKQTSIRFNFIMNIILTMSSFIFPLITFPYVSRILLSDGLGKISFSTSIISYFAMIAQMGIPTYGIRACAKVRDNRNELSKTVTEILIINIIMMIISYALLFVSLGVVSKFNSYKTLLIISSFTMFFNMIGMEWLYKALEQYKYITIRSIIFKIIAVILMFVLIHSKSDYIIYAILVIFASSASNILNFINIHKYVDIKFTKGLNLTRHLKPIFIFFAMSCAISIYTNLDATMLGFIINDSAVGYYNVAIKVRTILLSVITSLGAVILPRASYYIENKMFKEFNNISKKAMKFVLIISLPLCIFFMIFSKETILLLSGKNFTNSIIPMVILLPTLLFVGLSNITGIQMLIPLDKEKHVLISEILGAGTDLIINILLIPRFGCIGAAIGTLIAEFVVLLYQVCVLEKMGYSLFKKFNFRPIIISCIASIIITVILHSIKLGIVIKFMLGFIVFFGVYFLCLLIFKEDFIIETINDFYKKVRRKIHEEN